MSINSCRRHDNSEALGAFVARKTEFDRLLSRLQRLSDDHFHVLPDQVNWGHAGDVGHYVELLRRITDSAFKEGECAD